MTSKAAVKTTIVAGVVLAVFGAFSVWCCATQGVFGWIQLAGEERWALQMLLDLGFALTFAIGWMRADARQRGITAWPYIIATIALGSLGFLLYVVRRGFAKS